MVAPPNLLQKKKNATNWGLNIQMPEPIGNILKLSHDMYMYIYYTSKPSHTTIPWLVSITEEENLLISFHVFKPRENSRFMLYEIFKLEVNIQIRQRHLLFLDTSAVA